MTKPFHLAAAALVAALVCSTAGAQMRGGMSGMRMPSVRVGSSVRTSAGIPYAIRQAPITRLSPSGRVSPQSSSSFANSVRFGGTNGVPGLGFDYPHLAAIRGSLRNNARTNFGRGAHRRQTTLVPIVIGGYPYYYPDYYPGDYYTDTSDNQQPEQPPQVIEPPPMPPQVPDSGYAPAASSAPPAPVRDVGDFLLVRQDGRILFASAFSVAVAQVTYVTPEGIRRTLPLADLDTGATEQMNEARGTTVQIRN